MADGAKTKLVNFQKSYDEALGITLRVNERGYCIVARIMHGGLIHQQGLLHIGDRIVEVNGMDVKGLSVEALQKMLKDSYGTICLKIIAGFKCPQSQCEIFIRALFDYDPLQDDLIPCPQAGMPFSTRDILQVISKDDQSWWQARHWSPPPTATPATPPLPHQTRLPCKHQCDTKFQTVPSANHNHHNNNHNNNNYPPFMAHSFNTQTLNHHNNNNLYNNNNNFYNNNNNTIHKFTYNIENQKIPAFQSDVDDYDDDGRGDDDDAGGGREAGGYGCVDASPFDHTALLRGVQKLNFNNNNNNNNYNNYINNNNNFNHPHHDNNATFGLSFPTDNDNNNNHRFKQYSSNKQQQQQQQAAQQHTPPFSTTSSSLAGQPSGLIPSPELQEWRLACCSVEKNKKFQCSWFGLKKRLHHCTTSPNTPSPSADLLTYEEVILMPLHARKTIVLLDTTRKARKEEESGRSLIFVTHEQMMADIGANKYLEYGTHDDCMYGTKLDTIKSIHQARLVAVLDVEPQALKTLRNAEYSPYVVFICPPNVSPTFEEDNLETLLTESEDLERLYGAFFDLKVVNNDTDDTIQTLLRHFEAACSTPQWIPISWVY